VEEMETAWDVPFAAMAAQFVRVILCVSVCFTLEFDSKEVGEIFLGCKRRLH
jgi:hypothetical protein